MKPKISMPEEPFSALEREVIMLYAIWDMISGMVNRAMFTTKFLYAGELHFQSDECQTIFAILLADFLSLASDGLFNLPRPERNCARIDKTFLFYLQLLSQQPLLGEDTAALRLAVQGFSNWLQEETTISNLWLPSVEIQVELRISRITIFELCGNAAKHGFSRLSGDVGVTEQLLQEHGHTLLDGSSFQAHSELTHWLSEEGPLNYLAPVAAEHLNKIRWALYRYLKPVFNQYAYTENGRHFRYLYPDGCNAQLAREFYWNLMNTVIREPYFPEFELAKHIRDIQ